MQWQIRVLNELGTFESNARELTDDELAALHAGLGRLHEMTQLTLDLASGGKVYFGPDLLRRSVVAVVRPKYGEA